MKSKKINNNGNIPNELVHQINEHTVGGFIIFYFNQESGKPEQYMAFDSPAHALAIQKHLSDWSEAVHQVNLENSVNSIQNCLESYRDDESDEEEE